MVIAVAAEKRDPDPVVSSYFGRSSCFVLVNTENEIQEVVENPYAQSLGDGGIQSAQMLIERNIDAVIADRVGMNALRILSAADVRVYRCAGTSAREALRLFLDGNLERVISPANGAGNRRRRRFAKRNWK